MAYNHPLFPTTAPRRLRSLDRLPSRQAKSGARGIERTNCRPNQKETGRGVNEINTWRAARMANDELT